MGLDLALVLDMYVFAKKTDLTDDVQVDFDVDYDWEKDQICYWRKHPSLHGWMQSLYYQKGGKMEEYTGGKLRLTDEDVDALEKAIEEDALPFVQGVFIGQPQGAEDHEIRKAHDLECVEQMRDALCQGFTVWYTSSF